MIDSLQTRCDELSRTLDEQAALRRVATLVARGISPATLFCEVTAETGVLLGAEKIAVVRFEQDRSVTVAGAWEKPDAERIALPLGSRWPAEEDGVASRVQRTGKPARVASYRCSAGAESDWARAHGICSSTGIPIVADEQLWGGLVSFSARAADDPEGTEDLLDAFTELVALAIANSASRARLAASRTRAIALADETRRRIERELHAGAQQRLISMALELRAAESRVPPELHSHVEQWSRTAQGLIDAAEELRKMSANLHPAILDRAGLAPAVRAVTRRAGVPVKLSMHVHGRLPQRVEVAAYYVVSEALANAAKYARASVIEVGMRVVNDDLRLHVRDDGVGGADAARGSGLIALRDRVEAADGQIEIASPPGEGTSLLVTIPLTSD